jgi:hypothetical protein
MELPIGIKSQGIPPFLASPVGIIRVSFPFTTSTMKGMTPMIVRFDPKPEKGSISRFRFPGCGVRPIPFRGNPG